MKNPKTFLCVLLIMTFCLGVIYSVTVDVIGNIDKLKEIGPLGYILFGCLLLACVLIPYFCYETLKKNKFTIEKIVKEKTS